jgi:hypothetical protein
VKRSVQRSIPAKLASSLAIVALLTTLAAAQRTAHAAAPHFNKPTASFAFAQNAHSSAFRRSSPRTSLAFPFLGDFNLDDFYSSGYPVASQPPVFLMQAAKTLSGSSDYLAQPKNDRKSFSPTQPLMIELQNGRYVRVPSTPANGEVLSFEAQPSPTQPAKLTRPNATRPAASNSIAQTSALTPAVLVFRDGHTEEVRDYAIADGVLYARGDYYTDGYWNKNIAISSLNISQTLEANTTRNVKFVLPASPNKVITRP